MERFILVTPDNRQICKVKDMSSVHIIALPEKVEDEIENYLIGEIFPTFRLINLESGQVIETFEAFNELKDFEICYKYKESIFSSKDLVKDDLTFMFKWITFLQHLKGDMPINDLIEFQMFLKNKKDL
jgi:hypothetical protein